MKYLTIVQVLVAVVAALPSPVDDAAQRRVDVTFCRRENFDDCTVFKDVERQVCLNVPLSLSDRIRSITFTGSDDCTFYTDPDCHGDNFTDAGNMPDLRRRFRDKISSYTCQ